VMIIGTLSLFLFHVTTPSPDYLSVCS
jgi:hypothetical protein